MFVAVHADEFLGKILITFDVFPVSRDPHRQRIAGKFRIEIQILKDPEHVFLGDRDTQDA